MIVIYHASCYDGFCAAWILSKVYPDAEFMPFQYGMAAPSVVGEDVIVADFSFPEPETLAMIAEAKSFLCFDHHKTVPQSLRDFPQFVFDLEKSGARLVWEHYLPALPNEFLAVHGQWLVDYTEDRDLWRFVYPGSRAVNAGLRLVPFEFAAWDEISFNEALIDGKTLLKYFNKRTEAAAHNSKPVVVSVGDKEHVVFCVNETNPDYISNVGESLASAVGCDFGMTYFFDGEEFVFSLRSRSEFDVSEIAKHFGGGGHKNAAGFRRKEMFPLAVEALV